MEFTIETEIEHTSNLEHYTKVSVEVRMHSQNEVDYSFEYVVYDKDNNLLLLNKEESDVMDNIVDDVCYEKAYDSYIEDRNSRMDFLENEELNDKT